MSKRGDDDDENGFGSSSFSCDFGSNSGTSDPFPAKRLPSFDFTPPTHKHPKDPSISSQDLIDKGVLSIENFRSGNAALSVEAYVNYITMVESAASTAASVAAAAVSRQGL